MNVSPAAKARPDAGPLSIHAHRLTRIYTVGSVQVTGVDGIDLSVTRGQLVVLKGDSGSGKSTLLLLLAGLDRLSTGELTIAGHDLNQFSEAELTNFRRNTVGMIFQAFNLLPTLSVLENVCLPALLAGRAYHEVRSRAKELLNWLGLGDRLSHQPHQLSGGEMQRTAIARALINDPAIVLADEPTGNKVLAQLDPNGLAMVEGGRIALCDIATFQEFTGQFGLADRIDIRLKPDAAGDALTTLQPLLPAGVVMRSPAERSESGQAMIRAYQLSLTFLSFIYLFVGMFLVYSLVALNAAARRRELAVMRATGASGRLLFFLFVGEGAFIGLCGWLLALPISSLLVKTLLAGVSRTVTPNLDDQEMRTPKSTNVVYWEGSVQAKGTHREKVIEGVGYVELTGYAQPFDAPM